MKKEGKDYIFGDSKAAIRLSKMIYEEHPEEFHRVTRVMNNINALINKCALIPDTDIKTWLYKAIKRHIEEALPSVKIEAIRTHAQNVLIKNLRMAFFPRQ
jgi:hypothetical protein